MRAQQSQQNATWHLVSLHIFGVTDQVLKKLAAMQSVWGLLTVLSI